MEIFTVSKNLSGISVKEVLRIKGAWYYTPYLNGKEQRSSMECSYSKSFLSKNEAIEYKRHLFKNKIEQLESSKKYYINESKKFEQTLLTNH